MNKFTKLLSVFVIAGAVSAGVATLAGCGPKHVAEKHEAVAATCTQTGTKEYYTCSEEGCKGKYYQDEACTIEVTMEDLTIAALGHSATKTDAKDATCTTDGNPVYYTCSGTECAGKYYEDEACTKPITDIVIEATGHSYGAASDNGDGTHSSTCTACGDVATEAHVDENDDAACDDCAAKFFAPGTFYNAEYQLDIEIKQGGKVVYCGGESEYELSAIAEDAETHVLTATFNDGNKDYTLTKTATGYTLTYEGWFGPVSKELVPAPELIVESCDEFAGVFTGELTYSDYYGTYKVTKIAVSAEGKVLVTQVQTGGSTGTPEEGVTYYPVTTLTDGSSYQVYFNNWNVGYWDITAKTSDKVGEGYQVTSIEIIKGGVSATFTKTTDAAPVIPEALPVDNYSYYVGTEADKEYTLSVTDPAEVYYPYSLNGSFISLLSGDDTNGYLVKGYDSNHNDINYLLKISADKNTIEVYGSDLTTKLVTLTKQTISYPTLKVDGTANNKAGDNPFNSYAYYTVEAAGWYTFTADSYITIYTAVDGNDVTNYGESVLSISAGGKKTVQLAAGAVIAVDDYYTEASFTATYSEKEPEIEYESFTDGKYVIASFDGTETYYIKGTVGTAGKYYVTAVSEERATETEDRVGLVFEIDGVEYGSYLNSSWQWTLKDAGSVYSATLEANAEVKVKLTAGYTYLSGKVTVYFETEEEYNARLNGGSTGGDEETDLFSANQIGTYVYADGNNLTFKVEANQITMSGGQYGYGTYNPTITKSGDSYTLSYMGYKLVFSFNAAGNIAVTSDNIYDYNSFVAVKQGKEPTTPVAVVGNNTVSAGMTGNGSLILNEAGTWTVTYVSGVSYILLNNGLVVDGGTVTVTAGNPLTIVVYVDVANATEAVINLAFTESSGGGEEGGEEGGEATEGGLALGANTISNFTSYLATETFTATSTGDYTFAFANGYSGGIGTAVNGQMVTIAADGTGSITVALTAGQTITITVDEPWSGNVTLTITKA